VDPDKPITPRHVAMSWAQRLKHVSGIDIETCTGCGEVKVETSPVTRGVVNEPMRRGDCSRE
jgi:hypothetical protein